VDVLKEIECRLFIGGKWVDGLSGEKMEVINPANGETLAEVVKANGADVDRAYDAALEAFPKWRDLGWRKRVEMIFRLADKLLENKEKLARIDALDSGNPIKGMRIDVDIAVAFIRQYCSMMGALTGSTVEASHPDNLHYTRFEPYGVVGRIIAFNHPLMFAASRIIPALLTGNTVIIKPSDYTPLSALALGNIFQEVFPPGVVNIITGDARAGAAIVQHPGIKRIAFTGSTRTGMKIQEDAAQVAVKHISLELGGKNPQIVFPDADVDEAVKYAIIGMNYGVCQGQSCGSNSRIFLHEEIYDDFMDKLQSRVESLVTGLPLDDQTDIGPLVSKQQLEKVLYYLEEGRKEGATLVTGGVRPSSGELAKGFFVTPAIMENVTSTMKIAQEEIFGPVMSVLKWRDTETMIKEANSVEYGLTASIWTRDLKTAHLTANRLQAGYIWINDTNAHYPGTPFGGFKNSGIGREESLDELKSYCEQKVVHVILKR
jgi:acyl-CoA reductase-like NAD-dependent aldehyde dehydrogenase